METSYKLRLTDLMVNANNVTQSEQHFTINSADTWGLTFLIFCKNLSEASQSARNLSSTDKMKAAAPNRKVTT